MGLSKRPSIGFNIENKYSDNGMICQSLHITFYDKDYPKEIVDEFMQFVNSMKAIMERYGSSPIGLKYFNHFSKFTSSEYRNLLFAYTEQNIDLFFSILIERTKNTVNEYITEEFVRPLQKTISHSERIDTILEGYKHKYPLVPNGLFAKTKQKKYINTCIDEIRDQIDQSIEDTTNRQYKNYKAEYPSMDDFSLIVYAISDIIFKGICTGEFLQEKFIEVREQNIIHRLIREQYKKEKSKQNRKKKPSTKGEAPQSQAMQDAKAQQAKEEKKDIFEYIFKDFTEEIEKKVHTALDGIKQYIRRMYKKNGQVRMQYIREKLGEPYSAEIIQLVRNLCNELDVEIYEIEQEVVPQIEEKEPKGIAQLKKNITPSNNTVESQTLLRIKDTPEKLTTTKIIKILQEQGYRLYDENTFKKNCNKFTLEKECKTSLFMRKKIIDLLMKPEDQVREHKAVANQKYERMDLKGGNRLVKQGKTILWLVDHDTYEKLIQYHFVTNKTNFDTIVNNA